MGLLPEGTILKGSFRISCEDLHFRLRYETGMAVLDFPSWGLLARAGRIARKISTVIADLPSMPAFVKPLAGDHGGNGFLSDTDYLVAIRSRPVVRIVFKRGKPKFIPTPLRFFRKV